MQPVEPGVCTLQGVTAGILAGGQSHRMGQNKAELLYKGKPFTQHLAAQLAPCGQVLLSAPTGSRAYGLPLVPDIHPGHGPVGGLHALLTASKTPWLLAVSCDAPLFTTQAAVWLCGFITPGIQAVVPQTADGRQHPLCALWHKSSLPVLEKQIYSGQNRVMEVVKAIKTQYATVQGSGIPQSAFTNINTQQDYRFLLQQ